MFGKGKGRLRDGKPMTAESVELLERVEAAVAPFNGIAAGSSAEADRLRGELAAADAAASAALEAGDAEAYLLASRRRQDLPAMASAAHTRDTEARLARLASYEAALTPLRVEVGEAVDAAEQRVSDAEEALEDMRAASRLLDACQLEKAMLRGEVQRERDAARALDERRRAAAAARAEAELEGAFA